MDMKIDTKKLFLSMAYSFLLIISVLVFLLTLLFISFGMFLIPTYVGLFLIFVLLTYLFYRGHFSKLARKFK